MAEERIEGLSHRLLSQTGGDFLECISRFNDEFKEKYLQMVTDEVGKRKSGCFSDLGKLD